MLDRFLNTVYFKMAVRDSQAKTWMFTFNNPGDSAFDYCCGLELFNWKYIFQFEIGVNDGTRHIQGFIDTVTKVRFSTMRTRMAEAGFAGAHLEGCRNRKIGINYCRKQETRDEGPYTNFSAFELEAAGQGRRRDLEVLQADIKVGKSRLYIAENHFNSFLQYNNGIVKYQQLLQQPRSRHTARHIRIIFQWPLETVKQRLGCLHIIILIYQHSTIVLDWNYLTGGIFFNSKLV